MELHHAKTRLQAHFSDGCAVVVGSGLSCAEGLPGMATLAQHLIAVIGPGLGKEDLNLWDKIVIAIDANGLEVALLSTPPTSALEGAISRATASLILEKEQVAVAETFQGARTLRLTKLLPFIVKPPGGLPVITTNYDRLVEIAIEESGLGVDNMFFGRYCAQLNEKESRLSFCRDATFRGSRHVQFHYKPRAVVFKPHGSLDWYLRKGIPVWYSGEIQGATRLIITPGHNKFRNGYESPFDTHIAKANEAIDRASRFLVLGYGFNDDHLETHLSPAIKAGKPTLMLTHTLSPKAEALAKNFVNVIGLDQQTKDGELGTRVIIDRQAIFFPSAHFWDVNHFVSEIMEP